MRKLVPLKAEPPYVQYYIAIRDSKHLAVRERLLKEHAFVEARYDLLTAAVSVNTLHGLTIQTQEPDLQTALRACYKVTTKPLRALQALIRSVQPPRILKYCPMCGTTINSTFDHYLPAAHFPEFSVHALNLIPCCAKCNSGKGDDWLSAKGERQYLHAFSDEIPQAEFLAVTFHEEDSMMGVGARFSLTHPEGIAAHVWSLVVSHFEKLGLLERYSELSNDEIAEILSDCRIFVESGGQDLRDFLRRRSEERATVFGQNHWIAVLMKGLAVHQNLEKWVF